MIPDSPVFLIQQTYRRRAELPAVAAARVAAGHAPPGLLLDFGAVALDGVRNDASNRGHLAPLMTTSCVYGTETKAKKPMAQWVRRAAPDTRAKWDATVRDALAEQRSLGVDALSVPGIELSAADALALESQVDAIRRAWRSRPGGDPPWFADLLLHDDWLLNGSLRRVALNNLTDLPDDIGIALHVSYAKRDALGDANTLNGLRQVVRVLADDGRRVFLIQSGLVGWLSIAWGAWGFSAGMSAGSWLSNRAVIRRRAGTPSPPRQERYLEHQLLHSVLWGDHGRLAQQSDYQQCACSFCTRLAQGFAEVAASQHDLYALAELTRRCSAGDRTARRDAVRATLEAAQNQWAAWKSIQGLSPRAQPRHLATWRGLV
jgi:hypothetical protein